MAPPPAASGPSRPTRAAAGGPKRAPVKPTPRSTSAAGPAAATATKAKVEAAATAAQRKGKQPLRPTATVPAGGKGKVAPATNLQEGEEEWAALMKRQHGDKGADWYARGVKTVEVGYKREVSLTFRTSGSCSRPSSRSRVSSSSTSTRSTTLSTRISRRFSTPTRSSCPMPTRGTTFDTRTFVSVARCARRSAR